MAAAKSKNKSENAILLGQVHPTQRKRVEAIIRAYGVTPTPVEEISDNDLIMRFPFGGLAEQARMFAEVPGNNYYIRDDKYTAEISLKPSISSSIVHDPFIVAANEMIRDKNNKATENTTTSESSADPGEAVKSPRKSLRSSRQKKLTIPEISTRNRSYNYLVLEQAQLENTTGPSKFRTRESSKEARPRYLYNMRYANVVFLHDLASEASAANWFKLFINNSDVLYYGKPIYVHGMLIQGIHFDLHMADKANEIFRTLPISDVVAESLANNKNIPAPVRDKYGYVTVGTIVFTSFPNHDEWQASLPQGEDTPDDLMFSRWRDIIVNNVTQEIKATQDKIEKLTRQILELELEAGKLRVMERATKESSYATIQDMYAKLKEIPELDSITTKPYGFEVKTKDMFAYRQKTREKAYCGRFEIQVNINGSVRVRNFASPTSNWRNPHDSCLGTFGLVFSQALGRFDYYSLILSIMEYYRMIDSDHDSSWYDIPHSMKPPAKTHVSKWQVVVGTWQEENYGVESSWESLILHDAIQNFDSDDYYTEEYDDPYDDDDDL